jgi:dolichyl-phosphate-mannose-protein mannosyltransferase
LNREKWSKALIWLTAISLVVGVVLRFYRLSYPHKPVFDEVYFPVFANDYLHGKSFFDVHPPLGKFIMEIGLQLFGNTQLGWRIVPCIFGVGIISLMAVLYRRLFKDNIGALALVGFLALDGLFVCYSRTGLMDGILFFATFMCVWAASQMGDPVLVDPSSSDYARPLLERVPTWANRWAPLLCALALGAAISIKWTALSAIIPMFWYAWRAKRIPAFLAWLPLTFAIYFTIVCIGQWRIGEAHPIQAAIMWHKQAGEYHLNLTKTHAWGSPWWTWPLEIRPVLFLYDKKPDDAYSVMTTLANPALLWASTVTVLFSVGWLIKAKVKEGLKMTLHPIFPVLLGYFASWLPFAPVHRVMFFYHYMPAYGFALMLVAYWLGQVAKQSRAAVFAFCAFIAALAIYEMPFALGYVKLSQEQIRMRTLNRWWIPDSSKAK